MTTDPIEVLVVGAGPSGLFAAVDLARHGVRARIVERRPHPHREARATALQPGTLEILARAEVLDEVIASSLHLPFARVFDAELAQVSEMRFAGAGCRWEYQCSLPQWRTEQILADRLSSLDVSLERGVTVSSVHPRADAVLVTLERPDGRTESVETQYVLGAGGAHSVTRAAMAGALGGDTYPGTALAADVRVRCGLPRDGPALIATPEGYVLLTPLPDDWWLTFIGDLCADELERLERDRSADTIAGLLRRRITGKLELVDVDWASRFQMHRRIALRLAGERWFLLGDAGHLSSPFGGEGLNSGLHDGHNLAWKLALTVQGRARGALLRQLRARANARGSAGARGLRPAARPGALRGRGGAHRRTPGAPIGRARGGARTGAVDARHQLRGRPVARRVRGSRVAAGTRLPSPATASPTRLRRGPPTACCCSARLTRTGPPACAGAGTGWWTSPRGPRTGAGPERF